MTTDPLTAQIAAVLGEHGDWGWVPASDSPDHLYVCTCGEGGIALVTTPENAHRAHVAQKVADLLGGDGLRAGIEALAEQWERDSVNDHKQLCEDEWDCSRCCARELRALLDQRGEGEK